MVAHTCDPSTREAETGEWSLQGQPGLQTQTLTQKTKQNKTKKPKKGKEINYRFLNEKPTTNVPQIKKLHFSRPQHEDNTIGHSASNTHQLM
jgi:hypothetical protein